MRDWISTAELSTRLAAVITADIELALLDHLIVGDGRYFSFREAGVLDGARGEGLR